jgi:hypothetical protein
MRLFGKHLADRRKRLHRRAPGHQFTRRVVDDAVAGLETRNCAAFPWASWQNPPFTPARTWSWLATPIQKAVMLCFPALLT